MSKKTKRLIKKEKLKQEKCEHCLARQAFIDAVVQLGKLELREFQERAQQIREGKS